jgi:hypothetical protein
LSNFEEDKQRSIAVSVALNNSAVIVAALATHDTTADDMIRDYATVSTSLVAIVLDHHGIGEKRAVDIVSDVFPGATVVSTPEFQRALESARSDLQSPYQSAPAVQAGTPVPAVIPGAKDPDWLWRDFLGDPSGWYDNRVGKKNPSGPDFASKKHLNEKGFKEGLWLTGKFPLTAWVKTELQQRGYIS